MTRRVILEVTGPSNTYVAPEEERAWWQRCGRDLFKYKISQMDDVQVREVILEISAVLVNIEGQLGADRLDSDKRYKARRAYSVLKEFRLLAKAEVTSRANPAGTGKRTRAKRRFVVIQHARKVLDDGDVAGAVRILLDYMSPKNEEEHEALLSKSDAYFDSDEITSVDTRCAVCGEAQFLTGSGVSCPNGHGGAGSL